MSPTNRDRETTNKKHRFFVKGEVFSLICFFIGNFWGGVGEKVGESARKAWRIRG